MHDDTNLRYLLRGLLFLFFINNANGAIAITSLGNEPLSIGNFSLSTSQQPGPFFSFGQNIIDKNQLIASFNPSYLSSFSQNITEGVPSLLYGITDAASLLITFPFAFSYQNGYQTLSGMGDLAIDLEYAFYSNDTDQATLVLSPSFPTSNLTTLNSSHRVSGFSRKNSVASLNTFSYFIGATYAHTVTDWYHFISPGILFIDKQKNIQQGTQYFYNWGIGHNIKSVEKQYLSAALLEINGQYSEKNKLASTIAPNTGGNIIYATPSFWFSTPNFIFQIGISLPINQYWYGNQSNISYYAGSILSWTIQ